MYCVQMVKMTGQDGESRYKKEPIVTRSVAAREAAAAGGGQQDFSDVIGLAARQLGKVKAADTLSDTSSPMTPASALDAHNYAKSPMTTASCSPEHDEESNAAIGTSTVKVKTERADELSLSTDDTSLRMDLERLHAKHLRSVGDGQRVKIRISVGSDADGGGTLSTLRTIAATDVTKPLVIETKFSDDTAIRGPPSPGPCSGGSSSSTDTASEVASLLNSPVESGDDSSLDIIGDDDVVGSKVEPDERFSSDLTGGGSRYRDDDAKDVKVKSSFERDEHKLLMEVDDNNGDKKVHDLTGKLSKECSPSPNPGFTPKVIALLC